MELAFREGLQNEKLLCQGVDREVLRFVLKATLWIFILFAWRTLPMPLSIGGSIVIGVLWALKRFLFSVAHSWRKILTALFGPYVVLTVGGHVSYLLAGRVPVAPFLLTTSLCLFGLVWLRIHPIRFYLDWIYTAPNLRPESRWKRGGKWSWRANLALFMVLSFILWLLLWALVAYSVALALVVLLFFGLVLNWFNPVRSYLLARKVLAHYLTYGSQHSGAPGVWVPQSSLRRRRIFIATSVFLFYLSLAIGCCLYFPADLIAVDQTVKREQQIIADPKTHQERLEVEPRKSEAIDEALRNYYSPERLWKEYAPDPAGLSVPRRFLKFLFKMSLHRADNATEAAYTVFHGWWETWDLKLSGMFYFVLVPVSLSLVVPNLLLLGLLRAFLARSDQIRAQVEAQDRDGRSPWQWYIDRLRVSRHQAVDPDGNVLKEAEHLFLGIEPHLNFPVLLDKKILSEHCYIVGQTGSGKTALGIMPLLIQLIRGPAVGSSEERVSHPIVILDLKGDQALFHTARIEAELSGQEFKFFTLEKGKTTYYFDPFAAFGTENRTLSEVCQLFLEALSLNHGEFYGGSFYSRQSRLLLQDALSDKSNPQTFSALYEVATDLIRQRPTYYRDCYELIATLHGLMGYEQLVTTGKRPEQVIDLREVIRKRQVVYFWLPSVLESMSVREVAKLALYALITAAKDLSQDETIPESEKVQTYLFCDEFQRIAAQNFRIILEQARSFGVGAILANQTISDLKTRDFDLRATIRTNTRLQLYFSVTDPREVQSLSDLSGQEVSITRSWTATEGWISGGGWIRRGLKEQAQRSSSMQEQLKNRLTANDISRISDHPFDFIAHVTRGSGYTQFGGLPLPVRTSWPLPSHVYTHRLKKEPWPKQEEFQAGTTTASPEEPVKRDREAKIKLKNELMDKWIDEAEAKMKFLTDPRNDA